MCAYHCVIKLANTTCWPCTKCFININSSNVSVHHKFINKILLLIPFYNQGNQRTERLSNLSRVQQQASSQGRIWIQKVCTLNYFALSLAQEYSSSLPCLRDFSSFYRYLFYFSYRYLLTPIAKERIEA